MYIVGVIPCRYQSSRFEGKSIALICGKPMVYHVWSRAQKATFLNKLIVATDDNRIYDVCLQYDIPSVLTSDKHRTGTDRISEVANRMEGDVFINVQGDEPLIDPASIDMLVSGFLKDSTEEVICTFSVIESPSDVVNTNVVKVITSHSGHALGFSRSPIPYPKEEGHQIYKRHLGLYGFRRQAILRFPQLPRRYLELSEGIELFRFLENDYRVKMLEVSDRNSIPVDVPDDVRRVEQILKSGGGVP